MRYPWTAGRVRSCLLAACLALAACQHEREAAATPDTPTDEVRLPPGSPKLAYLSIDTVRARTDRVVAVLPAQLVLDEDHTTRVASPVSGRIRTLDVQPGDRVEAGQALAHIVSSDIAQAQSDVRKAEAALTQATATLARSRDLYAHQVIAQKELEQAVSDEAQARAEAERARVRAELLGTAGEHGDFVLRAPIGGEIIDRSANPGTEVRGDTPSVLFTLSQLDTLWLTAQVYQPDLARVTRGAQLVFTTDALSGRRLSATVTYVGAALDPQTRTATVRARMPNAGRLLRPQTFGTARLMVPDTGRLPVVPTRALVTHGGGSVVFIEVEPGRFQRRVVVVASDDGEYATIAEGVRLGERVVSRGSLLLSTEIGAH